MNAKSYQLKNNNVLIRLHKENHRIKLSDDKELLIDTSFLENEHTDIVGTVIQVPEVADYGYDFLDNTKTFRVPIDIMPGDLVYCHYLSIQLALKQQRRDKVVYNPQGRIMVENDEMYILMRYENLFMALRDGKPILLNDHILVEPTYREVEIEAAKRGQYGLTLPESRIEEIKKETQYGIIRYNCGRNLLHQQDNAYFSDEDLAVGKEVFFQRGADIPLEYYLHKTFEKDKTLFRIKRRDIFMILD